MDDNKQRLIRAGALAEWMRSDEDVMTMVAACLGKRGLSSIGVLATEEPDTFDELYELAVDLRDQAPPMWVPQ